MQHKWLARLSMETPVRSFSSMGTRKRAADVVGEAAVNWAVRTGSLMADHILETLPDWPGGRDAEEIEALHRAAEASTVDTLAALFTNDHTRMTQSIEPLENTAFYVQSGIPLDHVIRNVHTGQQFITQRLVSSIESLVPEAQRMAVAVELTKDVADCWSRLVYNTSEEYHHELERWTTSEAGMRAALVRQLLDGVRVDPDAASRQLNYDITGPHTALVVWLDVLETESARHFDFDLVAEQVNRLGKSSAKPLVIRHGHPSALIWIQKQLPDLAELLSQHGSWPSALRMGVGRSNQGIYGFRQSHMEAKAAQQVVRLSGVQNLVTSYDSVEMVSMLMHDPDLAQEFVRAALGPLAGDEPRMHELRQTLASYIDARGSIAETALSLHTHRNTVSYRLRQVETLMGPGRDNLKIRCALELASWFPHLVLRPSAHEPSYQGHRSLMTGSGSPEYVRTKH